MSSDSQIVFSDPLEFQKTFQQCHKLHVNSFAINDQRCVYTTVQKFSECY